MADPWTIPVSDPPLFRLSIGDSVEGRIGSERGDPPNAEALRVLLAEPTPDPKESTE